MQQKTLCCSCARDKVLAPNIIVPVAATICFCSLRVAKLYGLHVADQTVGHQEHTWTSVLYPRFLLGTLTPTQTAVV